MYVPTPSCGDRHWWRIPPGYPSCGDGCHPALQTSDPAIHGAVSPDRKDPEVTDFIQKDSTLLSSSKRPTRSVVASVKAPFLWPNISLSKRLCEIPPRLTFTNGCFTRWLLMWMASAINSLPVPLSPVISTEALVRAMRATVFSTSINP